jgi:H+/Cl- antiporter ClcA
MKELISRELLFLFLALLLAIPISILFVYLVQLDPQPAVNVHTALVWEMDLLLLGAVLGFLGVYIMRLFAWVFKNVILS